MVKPHCGQNLERLAALSDGIFVLDIHSPVAHSIHNEYDLWLALRSLAPRFLVYRMSPITLGSFGVLALLFSWN